MRHCDWAIGGAIEGLVDLVPRRALQRELEHQGKIQGDVLERLCVDMDSAVEEGIQLGMNRPRRLMGSAIAKEMRGEVDRRGSCR